MTSGPPGDDRLSVDVVIPVLNEAHVLAESVTTVRTFLSEHLTGYTWRVIIVDNGSTDGTDRVGRELAGEFADVEFEHLRERGRGRALRHVWTRSTADIVCYTDVDLSTELAALPRMVRAIATEGYDLATGSRLLPESRTKRSVRREIVSRAYNLILHLVLRNSFSDAQCGFKAVSRQVVRNIIPHVKDNSWFFDTELMVLAEKAGYRIKDIPVRWVEDDDSRVKILRTAWDDLKGVARVRWTLWQGAARRVHPRVVVSKRVTS